MKEYQRIKTPPEKVEKVDLTPTETTAEEIDEKLNEFREMEAESLRQ